MVLEPVSVMLSCCWGFSFGSQGLKQYNCLRNILTFLLEPPPEDSVLTTLLTTLATDISSLSANRPTVCRVPVARLNGWLVDFQASCAINNNNKRLSLTSLATGI
jgi:hypothetical protein